MLPVKHAIVAPSLNIEGLLTLLAPLIALGTLHGALDIYCGRNTGSCEAP